MTTRGLATVLLALAGAVAMVACGGGSGRRGTDLVVTGSGPTEQVTGGQTIVFQMVVSNAGDGDASDVEINDLVGSQLALLDITCRAAGGAVCPDTTGPSMVASSMPAGSSLSFDVTVQLAATAKGTIQNSMTAQIESDTDNSNNRVTVSVPAYTPLGDLVVSGSGPVDAVAAGESVGFQTTVRNDGPDAATNLRISANVGTGLMLSGIVCTASGGATCPGTAGAVMTLASLPAGGALAFAVDATVAASANGLLSFAMSASADNDADNTNNSFSTSLSAYANDVGVVVTPPSGPLTGGSSATFTAVVANAGPGPAQNVALTNLLSSGLSPGGAISCVSVPSGLCPVAPAPAMTVPALPAGGSLTFTVPVVVDAGTNGSVSDTMTATAAGDSHTADNSKTASVNAVSIDLGVSETGAPTVAAGSNAVFTAVVGNPGAAAVSNLTINHALGGAGASGSSATITCAASAGAVCPSTGAAMTVPTLPAGRALRFTITVPVAATARGAIISTMSIAADGDPDTANNLASFTTIAIDPRNGSYKVFTADGSTASMTIDFDAGQYTMSGDTAKAFVAGDSDSHFVVAGAQRFSVAPDLIVGNHDFGDGLVPYVAGRRFGSTLADAQSARYNLVTRDTTDTTAVTRAGSAAIESDGTLFLCQRDDDAVRPVSNCAGALATYTLGAGANAEAVYTATPTSGTGPSYAFYVLRSGSSKVLVSADPATDGGGNPVRRLRIGLQDPAAIVGGTLFGPSTLGGWSRLTISATSYELAGVDGSAPVTPLTATLALLNDSGATALLSGPRSDGATVRVMRAGPLAISYGAYGSSASGELEITLP